MSRSDPTQPEIKGDPHLQQSSAPSPPHPPLPQAPDPAKDPGILPSIKSPPLDHGAIPETIDIFDLSPVAALKLFCGNVDTIVKFTGDVPPTPPPRLGIHDPSNLAEGKAGQQDVQASKHDENLPPGFVPSSKVHEHIDGVPFTRSAIGSPEAHHSEPVNIIGAGAEPLYIQHGALARKFFSKKPPPIATEDYLLRLHRYCPMSTAVYLTASHYINRLVVAERVLPLTPRNVHRLLLASLRVAMKAIEDLSYPHSRFAKVGGVTETELGRLEISFCFLTDFELKVDQEILQDEAVALKTGSSVAESTSSFEPKLPGRREKRKASSVLPSRPVPKELQAPS
ncbi:MAG: hypothetical protein Q9227_006285 [Pyrenula ochraceoflavens]